MKNIDWKYFLSKQNDDDDDKKNTHKSIKEDDISLGYKVQWTYLLTKQFPNS